MMAVLGHGHSHGGGGGHGHSHGGGGGHRHIHKGSGHEQGDHTERESGFYGDNPDDLEMLHQGGDHSGRGSPTVRRGGGRFENINVRAAFIHVIGDLIQSVGVVIAGYIIKFWVSCCEFSGC